MNEVAANEEVVQLRAQITALEELLEVYEQETLEKSSRLEKALQELIHAEDALRVLQSILESMGDAVIVVDETGSLLFSNAAAVALGYDVKQRTVLGTIPQSFYQETGSTPLPLDQFPIRRAMAGEAIDNLEIYWLDPHQQKHWLNVTARSLKDDQGNLRGAVAVFHDITPSKQTESALRTSEAQSRQQAEKLRHAFTQLSQTQAQLIQTEKMSSLGQLVAGVAHEINNPVNFIYGNITPAQDYIATLLHVLCLYQQQCPHLPPAIQAEIDDIDLDFIQQDLPKLLRSLEMGANRIRQIVSSLRNFSRLDEAEMKPVNIHDGIDNTLLILQNQLKSKADWQEVQVMKQYGNLPLVECYAGQLNQVFMNILSNAIDALSDLRDSRSLVSTLPQEGCASSWDMRREASRAQPTIWIRTELLERDRLSISIRNNGPSLSEAVTARVFDPFFTTKPVGQGTGLGLYISYQIITDKHKGTLKCVSTPDQGVEFLIHIPLRQA